MALWAVAVEGWPDGAYDVELQRNVKVIITVSLPRLVGCFVSRSLIPGVMCALKWQINWAHSMRP